MSIETQTFTKNKTYTFPSYKEVFRQDVPEGRTFKYWRAIKKPTKLPEDVSADSLASITKITTHTLGSTITYPNTDTIAYYPVTRQISLKIDEAYESVIRFAYLNEPGYKNYDNETNQKLPGNIADENANITIRIYAKPGYKVSHLKINGQRVDERISYGGNSDPDAVIEASTDNDFPENKINFTVRLTSEWLTKYGADEDDQLRFSVEYEKLTGTLVYYSTREESEPND